MTSQRRARSTALSVTALGLAGVLAGCGTSTPHTNAGDDGGSDAPQESITLAFSWWGNDDRAAVTEAAIAVFEERNPGITVDTTFATMDAYAPKLATQVAAGGTPDVFLIPMEFVRDYVDKGAALDLTDYVDKTIVLDDVQEGVAGIAKLDDAYWGFTLGTAASGMVYNTEVWAAAGLDAPDADFTWSDLKEAGAAIRESTGGTTAAMSDPGGTAGIFGLWLNQQGKVLFAEDGEVGFEQSDLIEWWQLMEDLRLSGATTDAGTTSSIDQSMQNSGLARGLAASELSALSLTNAYIETVGEDKIAIAPLPSDTDISGMSMGATNMAAISPKSAHPEEAAKFLNFMINDPDAAEILGLTRGLPVNMANYATLAETFEGGDRLVGEFVLAYQDEFISPDPLQPPGVSSLPNEFTLAYETIIFDRTTIDEAAASVYAKYAAAAG